MGRKLISFSVFILSFSLKFISRPVADSPLFPRGNRACAFGAKREKRAKRAKRALRKGAFVRAGRVTSTFALLGL